MARVVPAVDRAFTILALLRRRGALSVPQISGELRLPRSTVHELVQTLSGLGAIGPAPSGANRFTLGLLLHELGSAYLSEVDLAREGQAVAGMVAEACGETVHLASLDGAEVVYIAKVDSIHAVRMVSAVGRRLPAHCTAVGKVLLASLPDDELSGRLGPEGARLPGMTPNSITDPLALREALARVRMAGLALDDCESNRDVRCVAAPVYGYQGDVVAGMSISVPISRTAADWPAHLAKLVRGGAADLSRRLGHGAPPAEAVLARAAGTGA